MVWIQTTDLLLYLSLSWIQQGLELCFFWGHQQYQSGLKSGGVMDLGQKNFMLIFPSKFSTNFDFFPGKFPKNFDFFGQKFLKDLCYLLTNFRLSRQICHLHVNSGQITYFA